MAQERSSIWEKQASAKLIFVCFLLIVITFICFGGTYLQYKNQADAKRTEGLQAIPSYEAEEQKAQERK